MTSDLHEMQLSVRSFLAATPYSYVLLDTKLVIQAASGAYLSMTGVMEEEILGMPVFEAFPPSPENPDDGSPTAGGEFPTHLCMMEMPLSECSRTVST